MEPTNDVMDIGDVLENESAEPPSGAASDLQVDQSIAVASALAAAAVIAVPEPNPSPALLPEKKAKRWTWKKPAGKPKRPLSAYNIFFGDVRKQLVEEQAQKLGFKELAMSVSERWKNIGAQQKAQYENLAIVAKEKYIIELDKWKEKTRNEVRNVAGGVAGGGISQSTASQAINNAASQGSTPATSKPCPNCLVCTAIAADQDAPVCGPIYIIASKEYTAQLIRSSESPPTKQPEAPRDTLEGLGFLTGMQNDTVEDSKPKAQETEEEAAASSTSLPKFVFSVMPDGSIASDDFDCNLDHTRIGQDISSMWNQLEAHQTDPQPLDTGGSKAPMGDPGSHFQL